MIRAAAPVHAAWWEHPDLDALQPHRSPAELAAFFEHWSRELERIDRGVMSGEHRELFARARVALGESLKRGAGRRDRRTIVHADPHPRNVLMSRSEAQSAILIDWERWMVAPPPRDLAYVLSFGYSPKEKQKLRMRVLNHHFEMLGECGVSGYTWSQYVDDYHRTVLACLPNCVWLLSAPVLEEFWDQIVVNYADEVRASLEALRL